MRSFLGSGNLYCFLAQRLERVKSDIHNYGSGVSPLSPKKENAVATLALVFRPFDDPISLLINIECAYALRYVELNQRGTDVPWSVRQTAVYHKHKVDQSSSTWVIISISERAERCLDRYIKTSQHLIAENPFDVHLILVDIALANWRPYIVNLTERIMKQVCTTIRSITSSETQA